MIQVWESGGWLLDGAELVPDNDPGRAALQKRYGSIPSKVEAAGGTIAYGILESHNTSVGMDKLKLKFDAMASHDITYVGIIQTARASGLQEFPLPYVLTNCHNSLCAVGGTINEDDHMYGLTAAKKYGGVYVPAHQAVIHQYMREMMAGGGKMILGSDSHTRYGPLGTMAIGEGGPELVKQLLNRTYDIDRPEVVAVRLTGKPQPGVGPMDVALTLVGAVFKDGIVKNKVLEFIGDGIANLSADYRLGIDVMTTETTCLTSIWQTDKVIRDYLTMHGRPEAYKELKPESIAYYDGVVSINLDKVRPMIAMPFHPSNTYPIEELQQNLEDILREVERTGQEQLGDAGAPFRLLDKVEGGRLRLQQGVIAGCAGGTFENIRDAADILEGASIGSEAFALSVYAASQPVNLELSKNGVMARLMVAGATIRTAFCGPCFGAGDVPANNGLSARHVTRNFPSREGSKPGDGQIASVAIMDARSVAATARNHGFLTAATELDTAYTGLRYFFDRSVYDNRVYNGIGRAEPEQEIQFGPNITDWPAMEPLAEDLLLCVASLITDPVTTTDELIPSGETSSYRSNPLRLAEFTLSRKDPSYVGKAKSVQTLEKARLQGQNPLELDNRLREAFARLQAYPGVQQKEIANIGIGSVVYAVKPGDGSAREQAASCQKVLGTYANIAREYATKRYRSNLINWGMLPFLCKDIPFEAGDYIFIPAIRSAIREKAAKIQAYVLGGTVQPFTLEISPLTDDEREIILAGCLINYYASGK